MIDVHILIHPDTRPEWVRLCLSSVRLAAKQAAFPVDVHEVPAVLGHIGQGRAKGYALGSHPYVTSVDDDDWIDPDAFAVLAEALSWNPPAVTTWCVTHQNGYEQVRKWRDSMRVFRRDVAQTAPLQDWPVWESLAILTHAASYGAIPVVERPVYHYRLHRSPHRKAVQSASPEMRARYDALMATSPLAAEFPA